MADAQKPPRAIIYRGEKVSETSDLSLVVEALRDERATVWLDLQGEQGPEVSQLLREGFGLHPLVIEDMLLDYTVPKLEELPGYTYVLVHSIRRNGKLEDFDLDEVDILIGPRWVVTHHHASQPVDLVRTDCLKNQRLVEKGPAWIAHAVLDRVVDDYLPVLQQFEDQIDSVEEAVVSDEAGREVIERIFHLKRALMKVRRVTTYEREILARLSRGGSPFIPEQALPFFRDVQDHMANLAMVAENARELASNTLEMHLSMQSNRLNEVMKTLTMFSTTMMPMSLIAGIYGMNFEHMPELKWEHGYPMAILLMLTLGACMLVYFRRKKWL